jgi:hypothetical protein
MADKVEYSRLRIKRTDISGITPTIPTGSTLSEMTDTDLFIGELFMNGIDDRVWIRTDNTIVSIPTLSQIPTSPSGLTANQLYTQTATQLGGTGTTLVLCITPNLLP